MRDCEAFILLVSDFILAMVGDTTIDSLVSDVKDLLSSSHAAIAALKLLLMEGFGLVEIVAIGSPHLISPLILLSLPGSTIPALAIALVSTLQGVRSLVNLQFNSILEDSSIVSSPQVRLVMLFWVEEACSEGGRRVILRLVILSCVEHGPGTVSATSDLHCLVISWDQLKIEPISIETVRD